MFDPARPAELAVAPNRTVAYVVTGVALGLLIVVLARGTGRTGWPPATRTVTAALVSAWSIFAGAAGLVVAGMWGLTHHIFMYANENVLQMSPLSLALALLLPLSVRARARPRAAHLAALLAFVIVGLSLIGLLVQLLPLMRQRNGEIVGLALPLHAAAAYAVWRLTHPATTSSTSGESAAEDAGAA